MELNIRMEKKADFRWVEVLTRDAFWNVYVPGCMEHYLVHKLRKSKDFIPELSMVAELDGQVVGHIAYTRASLTGADGACREVLCFGPLSVRPSRQKTGIGSALIRTSLRRAKELGYKAVCIMGNPAYYSRFGFRCGERFEVTTADGRYAPALQVLELVPGALAEGGCFKESPDFDIDMEGFGAFEAKFEPRKPGHTLSQDTFAVLSGLMYHIGDTGYLTD